MRCFPIIPIWLMIIFCGGLLFFLLREKKIKEHIIEILIVLILFVINLRIMYPSNNAIVSANSLDVLFVVDDTISMNALDYNGKETRLSGVKEDLKYIVRELNGARFSLITFNNKASVVTPFTKDSNMTSEAIDIISPVEELYAKGSSLNIVKDAVIASLADSLEKGDRQRVIFFVSDGEITDGSSLKSFKEIKNYVSDGAVLGYGSKNGGYMKEYDKYADEWNYIMDRSDFKYEKAVSKLDEDNLEKLAEDMGVSYIHMEKQSKIDERLKNIKKLATSEFESSNKKAYNDTYFILIIPLLVLLGIKFKNTWEELL